MNRIFRFSHRATTLAITLSAFACGTDTKTEKEYAAIKQMSQLKDPHLAKKPIRKSASAVVKIETRFGSGTGFFINNQGVLVTNNHVLGVDNCGAEGCIFELYEDYENRKQYSSENVFAEPLLVRSDLDMAVYRIHKIDEDTEEKQSVYQNKSFLTFEKKASKELLNQETFVVGHPLGQLKKWSKGEVLLGDGKWFSFSNFAFPGNSGSPVLNEDGKVIGILHRGRDDIGQLSKDGLLHYMIGSSSAEMLDALKESGLLESNFKLTDPERNIHLLKKQDAFEDAKDIVKFTSVFINSRRESVKTSKEAVSESLTEFYLKQCEAAIENPNLDGPAELNENLEACTSLYFTVNCDSFSSLSTPEKAMHYCSERSDEDLNDRIVKAIRNRDRAISDFLGTSSEALFPYLAFKMSTDSDDAFDAIYKHYSETIEKDAEITLDIAGKLLRWLPDNNEPVFRGVNLLDKVLNYKKTPNYRHHGADIVDGIADAWMIKDSVKIKELKKIIKEKKFAVEALLEAETQLYLLELEQES